MRKPLAVERQEYMSSTGPTIYGIQRLEKIISPEGRVCVFLGVKDGEVYLECDDKLNPFLKIDSSDFSRWKKV